MSVKGSNIDMHISQNKTHALTSGVSISPTGAYNEIRNGKNKLQAVETTGSGGGSLPFSASVGTTSSSGGSTQEIGFMDITGDGLPDYFNGTNERGFQ
jgi:hypothetical protein